MKARGILHDRRRGVGFVDGSWSCGWIAWMQVSIRYSGSDWFFGMRTSLYRGARLRGWISAFRSKLLQSLVWVR